MVQTQTTTKQASKSFVEKPAATAEASQNQPVKVSDKDEFTEALNQVPALKKFTDSGHLYTTSKSNVNDQASAEYAIQVVKHLYQGFVILQYAIKNTLEDQVLSNLTLKIGGFQG